jgi:hypothetical protein
MMKEDLLKFQLTCNRVTEGGALLDDDDVVIVVLVVVVVVEVAPNSK